MKELAQIPDDRRSQPTLPLWLFATAGVAEFLFHLVNIRDMQESGAGGGVDHGEKQRRMALAAGGDRRRRPRAIR